MIGLRTSASILIDKGLSELERAAAVDLPLDRGLAKNRDPVCRCLSTWVQSR